MAEMNGPLPHGGVVAGDSSSVPVAPAIVPLTVPEPSRDASVKVVLQVPVTKLRAASIACSSMVRRIVPVTLLVSVRVPRQLPDRGPVPEGAVGERTASLPHETKRAAQAAATASRAAGQGMVMAGSSAQAAAPASRTRTRRPGNRPRTRGRRPGRAPRSCRC